MNACLLFEISLYQFLSNPILSQKSSLWHDIELHSAHGGQTTHSLGHSSVEYESHSFLHPITNRKIEKTNKIKINFPNFILLKFQKVFFLKEYQTFSRLSFQTLEYTFQNLPCQ
jgi:hypothetical protein